MEYFHDRDSDCCFGAVFAKKIECLGWDDFGNYFSVERMLLFCVRTDAARFDLAFADFAGEVDGANLAAGGIGSGFGDYAGGLRIDSIASNRAGGSFEPMR